MNLVKTLLASVALGCTFPALTTPAAAEAPPLSAYGALPDVEKVALSPSGKRHAMIATMAGKRVLMLVEGKNSLRTAELGQQKIRSISWLDDERLLVVVSETVKLGQTFVADKTELSRAFVLPVDPKSKAAWVFADDPGILSTFFGFYGVRRIGGRSVGFFSSPPLARAMETGTRAAGYEFDGWAPNLYAVDLQTMKSKIVAVRARESHGRDWLVDAAGAVAATYDFALETGEWKIANAGGTVIARGKDPEGDVDLEALGTGGDTVIYSTKDDAGIWQYFEVPLAGGEPREILAEADVDAILTDEVTGRYAGYRDSDDVRHMNDPRATQKFALVDKTFGQLNTTIREWTPDFNTMLVHTDGNKDSGTWFHVDVAGRRADAIAYERLPIGPEHVGPISTFGYKAGDGLDIDGVLTLPPGREAKRLPLVMLPHGGPHSHDTEGFDWWAQAFASRGYAVFQPNFRGSTNRDIAFRKAGYGQWGRKMQSDLTDGIKALAAKGIVDPARACIVGASYGGYAALAGVTLEQGIYKCAVAVAPVADLSILTSQELREMGRGHARIYKRYYDETMGPKSGYDAISPFRHAQKADAPILLIHGRDDTVVPYRHSTKMADALKDAGKPYRMVDLREEDHWLSKGATRLQMLTEAVAFVQEHNPAD